MSRALSPLDRVFERLAGVHRRRQPDLSLLPRHAGERGRGPHGEPAGLVAANASAMASGQPVSATPGSPPRGRGRPPALP